MRQRFFSIVLSSGSASAEAAKILAFPDHVLNLDAAYVGYPLFERVRVHGFLRPQLSRRTRPPDVRYVCDIFIATRAGQRRKKSIVGALYKKLPVLFQNAPCFSPRALMFPLLRADRISIRFSRARDSILT